MSSDEISASAEDTLAPQVAQADSGASREPIGQVETLDGRVTVTRADGTIVELKQGDPVFQGDTLDTGADGAVGIVLVDSSVFSLGEGGRMLLDEMVYDPGTEEGSATFALMTGAATFVSGQIAKFGQDAMMVKTPVATIGIRGTKVYLETDGETFRAINLPENTLEGQTAGEIVLMTPDGDMLGTVNQMGGGWKWTPSQSSTPTSIQLSDAQVTAIVQQTGAYLPLTLEEKALDTMQRVEDIRTEAQAARAEGDLERADRLEAQADALEVRLQEVLQEIGDRLGYEIDFSMGLDDDAGFDLADFETSAGAPADEPAEGPPSSPPPSGNTDPGTPFDDLFGPTTDAFPGPQPPTIAKPGTITRPSPGGGSDDDRNVPPATGGESGDTDANPPEPQAPWAWADGMAPGGKDASTVSERESNHIDEPQTIDRGAFGMGETSDTAVVEVSGSLGTYNAESHANYNDAFVFEVRDGETLDLSVISGQAVDLRVYAAGDLNGPYDHLNPPTALDPSGLTAGTYVAMLLTTERGPTDYSLNAALDLSNASLADRFDLLATHLPEQEQNYLTTDGTLVAHTVERSEFGAVSGDVAGIVFTGTLANNLDRPDTHNDAFQFDLAAGEWVTVSHPETAPESMRFQLFKVTDDGGVNTRLRPIDGQSPEDGGFSAHAAEGGSYVLRVWSEGHSGSLPYEVEVAIGDARSMSDLAGGELTDGLYWNASEASATDLFRIHATELPEQEQNYVETDGTVVAHQVERADFGTLNDDMAGIMLTGTLADNLRDPDRYNDGFRFELEAGEWITASHPDGAAPSMRFQLFRLGEDGTVDTETRSIEGWSPEDGPLAAQATEAGSYILRVWSEGHSGSLPYQIDVAVGTHDALSDLTGQDLTDSLASGDDENTDRFDLQALVREDFDDLIIDGLGNDILRGGDGPDTFLFDMDGDTDVITDFDFDDVLSVIGEDLAIDLEVTETGDPVLVVTAARDAPETRIILQGVDAEDLAAAIDGNPNAGYSVSSDPGEGITVIGNPGAAGP